MDTNNNTGVFFEENPNPMWIYEPESLKITAVNDAAVSLYGYSKQEFLSLTVKDLRPESEIEKLQKEVNKRKQVFNDSGIWLHEKKSGGLIYVRILSYPIKWEGKPCKLVVAQDVTKQKDIEQQYLTEQELLEVLVNNLPGIFYIFNRKGKMLRWNSRLKEVIGYSGKEIAGMAPQDFFVEEEQSIVLDAIKRAFSDGYAEVQADLLTKGGEKIPFYFRTSRIDINKKPHLIGIGIDMSSLKKAELRGKQNRLLFNAIMEQAESVITVKDREGRYQHVNRKYCELFNAGPEEVIGKKENTFHDEEMAEFLKESDKKVHRNGKAVEIEENFKTADGERTFVVVKYPLKNVPGYENSICSIATDITDLKSAEKELQKLYKREKEERLRIERINSRLKLLEKVSNIFAEEHTDYNMALKKVAKLLIRDVADICSFDVYKDGTLKRVAQEVIFPEKLELVQQIHQKDPKFFYNLNALEEVVSKGSPVLKRTFTRKDLKELVPNHELFELVDKLGIRSYFILPLRVKGKVLGTITLVILQDGREITEDDLSFLNELANKTALHVENSLINEELQSFNKNLEDKVKERTRQLENTNEELEAFSYSVSHDLRTPLRAIGGYTSLLLEDYYDELDKDGKEFLVIVSDEAKRMGELIDDLLSFSRISRKEKSGHMFSMNTLVWQCIDEVLKANHGVEPKLEVEDLPNVYGDPKLIRQIWVNLISNAVKYRKTGQRPYILIGSKRDDRKNHTVFYIEDNGVGFNMKYADKLFGVFQRLHSNDEFEGTGIGLALVRRIINRHGGDVWAHSEIDKGSTFYFSLPDIKEQYEKKVD